MSSKPDIVSLMWVMGLMNEQADNAEKALVDFSHNPSRKDALLQCMYAVHQITSTLQSLGMTKGEMLTLEMERSLSYLYKDKLEGERCKLTMGGLMQALKVLPAYLSHTQNVRRDTGQGLERYVNDLRRWAGLRPRPRALFSHLEFDDTQGITAGARPASDDNIKEVAETLLVPYLQMVKRALGGEETSQSMKTVARIAWKMQNLFTGVETERFWFTQIGLCEGIAGGLIAPDDCIAQIFKTGAFSIKYAREKGSELDPAVDYSEYLQQMLYYIASCRAKPVHIARIRETFGIDDSTLEAASQGLVHMDAIVTAMTGAMEQLNGVVAYLNSNDPLQAAKSAAGEYDRFALDGLEAAQYRLEAAGQVEQADAMVDVSLKLQAVYEGQYGGAAAQLEQVVEEAIRGITDVKLDIEHKLAHGLHSSYSSREFEARECVVSATFSQLGMVENQLQHILRRKALAAALARKPNDDESLLRLTGCLHRYLNKSEHGHEELRQAVRDAEYGDPDLDHLYSLAREFLNSLEDTPDRKAIERSLGLLEDVTHALDFAGMQRESRVVEQCRTWLEAASKAGAVREDDACRSFADAFAELELHLQRSIMDPLEDTSKLLARAEQRAVQLAGFAEGLSAGADVAVDDETGDYVEDVEVPPEIRAVFIEESDEIIQDLARLVEEWAADPQVNNVLRDIRRHFHTFKGNGRAVGANVLGELGWAAQDLLDHVLDGDLEPSDKMQQLVAEVVQALPALVNSYQGEAGLDVAHTRDLTDRCFRMVNMDGTDPAANMPHAAEASRGQIRLVASSPAPGQVTH